MGRQVVVPRLEPIVNHAPRAFLLVTVINTPDKAARVLDRCRALVRSDEFARPLEGWQHAEGQYHVFVPACCRSTLCAEMFTPRFARRSLRRYRKKGLDSIERQMVASVSAGELNGARILEIGGGIGTIQADLLAAGGSRGEIVELISAYEPYARELAQNKGIENRSTFRVADVLEQPETVRSADIVVLNRVVCCSVDGVQLTGRAARLAHRMLLLSYPRDRFLIRVMVGVLNGALRIMGRSFRVFLHPRDSLYAAAQVEGLRMTDTGRTMVWEFAALRREQQPT